MILGIGTTELVVIALVVVLGAALQNLVGLGLNLVSAPVLALLEPDLVPTMPLVLAVVLPALTLVRDHEEVDWRGLAWVMPARLPGSVLGVALLAWLSDRQLGLAVGVMVLVAVALTVRAFEVPMTRSWLLLAGLVSGVTGTTTSIGGPPVALLYQHRPPAQIRSTLAVFFALGALLSLVVLGVGGQLSRDGVLLALVLVPALVVGTLAGAPLRRVLPGPATRWAVLGICAASALVLLVRSLA
jgi:uncharacterized membrane protein YfcA